MKTKTKLMLVSLLLLTGCASIKTYVSFSKELSDGKVNGTVSGRLSKVQEFRSLLESLEYRLTEKPK